MTLPVRSEVVCTDQLRRGGAGQRRGTVVGATSYSRGTLTLEQMTRQIVVACEPGSLYAPVRLVDL